MIFSRIFRQRYAVAMCLALALCLVSFLTRIVLSMRPDVSGGGQELALSFLIGSAYDLITAPFMLAPLMLFLALLPNRVAHWRLPRLLISLGALVSTPKSRVAFYSFARRLPSSIQTLLSRGPF